jgi:haloalkane dehalogenase
MADSLPTAADMAYRLAGPDDGPPLLAVHGYPESSYLFRHALTAAGREGWRAVAPDLPGFGDSPPNRPGTWEHQMEALDRFHASLELGPVVLIGHDWGGLIGLRWACEHPEKVRGLVITDTGFFPDGKWHGLAQAMRTEGEGEKHVDAMTREGFGQMLDAACPGIGADTLDEFFKCFADQERRRGQLDLYRSGDFEKLEPYQGCLAELDVPALILWGADDPFAPPAGAHRFHKEIPGSELVVLEDTGHFLWEQAPERSSEELARFLRGLR